MACKSRNIEIKVKTCQDDAFKMIADACGEVKAGNNDSSLNKTMCDDSDSSNNISENVSVGSINHLFTNLIVQGKVIQ
jgi:hypothetical protein